MASVIPRLEEELKRLQDAFVQCKDQTPYDIHRQMYDLLEYTDKEIDKIVYHVGMPLQETQRNAMLESYYQLVRVRDKIKLCFIKNTQTDI